MSEHTLRPTDVLVIPRPARLLHDTLVGPDGQKELTLFCDEHQVTFDDPALIPFGERLLRESRFVAEETRSWSAAGYSWETVAELLAALVSEGLLELEEPGSTPVVAGATEAPRERIVGAGSIAGARAWTPATCRTLSADLFGVEIEAGNLESLIRAVRIAHPALDVGGRQVGELNVFPASLRLDLPTKVRTCPYRGSRSEQERPMNVTGLEPVQKCWRGILHDLRALKQEFFRRRPAAREGLTVADLYVLGAIALSIPAFMMHRAKDTVENGHLPLEVSAFFRVMDGVRMTSREMLTGLHPSFRGDAVPSAERFLHFADRELLLLTDMGVCAGPPQMIQTFLEAVMALDAEGAPLAPTPASGIGDIQAAAAYGIAACEVEAITDQFWLRQAAIVERLLSHLRERVDMSPLERALQARLEATREPGALAYLFLQEGVSRPEVYENFSHVIRHCEKLLGRPGHPDIPPFDDHVDAGDADVTAARAMLLEELPALEADTALEIALAAARLGRLEQQTFPRMAERQAECNAVLGRQPPSRPFDELDVAKAWPATSLRAALADVGITLAL